MPASPKEAIERTLFLVQIERRKLRLSPPKRHVNVATDESAIDYEFAPRVRESYTGFTTREAVRAQGKCPQARRWFLPHRVVINNEPPRREVLDENAFASGRTRGHYPPLRTTYGDKRAMGPGFSFEANRGRRTAAQSEPLSRTQPRSNLIPEGLTGWRACALASTVRVPVFLPRAWRLAGVAVQR